MKSRQKNYRQFELARVCFLLALMTSCLICNKLIFTNPNDPAFLIELTLDGANYHRSATTMLELDRWLLTPEIYHSVAQQILVSSIYHLFGPYPLAVRFFNLLCFWMSLYMVFVLSRQLGASSRKSLFVTAAVALLGLLQSYTATMQYEIPTMLLMLILMWLLLKSKYIAAGAVIAILFLFRVHFLFLVFPLTFYVCITNGLRPLIRLGIGFICVFLPIYAYYQVLFEPVFDFGFGRSGTAESVTLGLQYLPPHSVNRWLCRGAVGWNFPYFETTPTSLCGWNFITSAPSEYMGLLGRRLMYFTGVWREVSWAPPFPTLNLDFNHQQLIHRGIVGAVFLCWLLAAWRAFKFRNSLVLVLLSLPVFAFLPMLISGGAIRFLIPVLPLFFIGLVLPPAPAPRTESRKIA
jgi:hypothetical protein